MRYVVSYLEREQTILLSPHLVLEMPQFFFWL